MIHLGFVKTKLHCASWSGVSVPISRTQPPVRLRVWTAGGAGRCSPVMAPQPPTSGPGPKRAPTVPEHKEKSQRAMSAVDEETSGPTVMETMAHRGGFYSALPQAPFRVRPCLVRFAGGAECRAIVAVQAPAVPAKPDGCSSRHPKERRVRCREKARSLGHLAAHDRGTCRPTSQEWVPGEYRWLHEG